MKKKLAGFLAFLFAFGALGACGGKSSNPDAPTSEVTDSGSTASFKSVFSSNSEKSAAYDESVSFTIDEDISGKNYIRLKLKTNVQLLGQYTYANADNPSEVGVEDFFIEASDGVKEVEFKQFLDTYRPNAVGRYDKILKSITLTNKSEMNGEFTLLDVSVSDREIPSDAMMVFLENFILVKSYSKMIVSSSASPTGGGSSTSAGRTCC